MTFVFWVFAHFRGVFIWIVAIVSRALLEFYIGFFLLETPEVLNLYIF